MAGFLAVKDCGAVVSFIDLPFAMPMREDKRTHCSSSERLRGSDPIKALCQALKGEA
jgi:hypothetical protein